MNDIVNPYEVTVTVRYILAGIVMVIGLCVALRSMEKEREQFFKDYSQKRIDFFIKNKRKIYDERPFLSRPVDEFVGLFCSWLVEKCIVIRIKILMLLAWGRVAVLITTMAFYCCILVYFKLDETSMKREKKALYEQIEKAVKKN